MAPPLVDKDRYEKAIDSLHAELDAKQIEILKTRWLARLLYWDWRSRTARRKYFRLRFVTVMGAVALPLLSSAALVNQGLQQGLTILAAVVGAAVAAAATWEGIQNYGQIWLEKRRAAEVLNSEGWLFIEGAEKYHGVSHADAFPRFAAEMEHLIVREVGEYVATFDLTQSSARVAAHEDLLERGLETGPKALDAGRSRGVEGQVGG